MTMEKQHYKGFTVNGAIVWHASGASPLTLCDRDTKTWTSWEWLLRTRWVTHPRLAFTQVSQAPGQVSVLKCNLNHSLPSSDLSQKPRELSWASLGLSGVGTRPEQVEILSSGPLWPELISWCLSTGCHLAIELFTVIPAVPDCYGAPLRTGGLLHVLDLSCSHGREKQSGHRIFCSRYTDGTLSFTGFVGTS